MSVFMEPKLLLQAFYLSASAAILLAYLTPALNKRFLPYGARDAAEPRVEKDGSPSTFEAKTTATRQSGLLDSISDVKVPHKWFIHFYITSVLSSAFWAYQIVTCGQVYSFFASLVSPSNDPNGTLRVVGCWFLFTLQGLRRLYESLRQPQGSSKMWVGHYAIGIAFYLATGIAIWIEGLPALKAFHETADGNSFKVPSKRRPRSEGPDILAIFIFFAAWVEQYKYHTHLASLRKYTVPTHYGFETVVAPHYTSECIIYLCLVVLSRPEGCYINHTMAAALVFVVVNLGISADGTKRWMRNKFGEESVAKKWRMIPRVW